MRARPPPAGERQTTPKSLRMITQSNVDKLVTVFGGSGFLGRHVVRALCKRGYRVRVAVRRPDRMREARLRPARLDKPKAADIPSAH